MENPPTGGAIVSGLGGAAAFEALAPAYSMIRTVSAEPNP